MRIDRISVYFLTLVLLLSESVWSRTAGEYGTIKDYSTSVSATEDKAHCTVSHSVGKLVLAVSNRGVIAGTTAWSDNLYS